MPDQIKLFQNDRIWAEIGPEVIELVNEAHALGQAQNGNITKLLEATLANKFRRKHCITVGCCTDALDIALQALKLGEKAHVAVPNYTFTATAHAVKRAGYTVIPVDVNDHYCIDKHNISGVDAIVAVDLFGNMSDYARLKELNIPIIVDAAQSLESRDHAGKWSAEYGIASCISFSPSKTVSSWGSGGAILTDDDQLASAARRLRLHGKLKNDDLSVGAGLNSMMSSFECAAVLVGLKHAEAWQKRRHEISRHIMGNSNLQCAINDTDVSQHTYSKLVFQSDFRDTVFAKFKERNIDCVVHYNTLINDETLYHTNNEFTMSKYLQNISFTVPNQHTLTDAEVERITEALS